MKGLIDFAADITGESVGRDADERHVRVAHAHREPSATLTGEQLSKETRFHAQSVDHHTPNQA